MYKGFIAMAVALASLAPCKALSLTCNASSAQQTVRAEGLAERLGDVVLDCSGGTPGGSATLNFDILLNVNITNRIDSANRTDAAISTDTGTGAVTSSVPGLLIGPMQLYFKGVPVTFSSTGTVIIRITGIRGNATQTTTATPTITETLAVFDSGPVALSNSSLVVGRATTGLYSSESGATACNQRGSAGPGNTSFASFVAKAVPADSIRITAGFPVALAPKSNVQNLGADSGTRVLVTYSGAPAGTVLYVPDVIAGSDATVPTSAGAFGLKAAGGKFTPSAAGSLVLARVSGADANGAGGTPVYTPGAPGSGAVVFDNLSAIPTTNGTATIVYEVVDASGAAQETAQIPVFVTFPPIYTGLTYTLTEQTALAPVSTVTQASTTAPIPRFTGTAAPSDCPVLGDCTAPTTPTVLTVTSSANFTVGTVVPGSLATIIGSNLKGSEVSVTFDGVPSKLLYKDARQINLMVPNEVAGMTETQMVLSVDGQNVYDVVPLQTFSPAVFPGAVLNQDNSVNSPATTAQPGTVIQVWGTGIAQNGVVTATMGGQSIGAPVWWGSAPGIPGVQQVNLMVPSSLQFTGKTTTFSICQASAAAPARTVCSPEQTLNVSR